MYNVHNFQAKHDLEERDNENRHSDFVLNCCTIHFSKCSKTLTIYVGASLYVCWHAFKCVELPNTCTVKGGAICIVIG